MNAKTNDWTLHFATHSRNEALYMADFLARAVDSKFFHDPDDVPLFIVTGGFNHGKSMICEAMSRSIIDQESIEKMIKEGQRFHHYLETAPSTACYEYCFQLGTIDGKPGAVSFDRITERQLPRTHAELQAVQAASGGLAGLFGFSGKQGKRGFAEQLYQDTFSMHTTLYTGLKDQYAMTEGGAIYLPTGEKAALSQACKNKQKVGGAIFSSGHYSLGVTPWIQFNVEQPEFPDYKSRAAAVNISSKDEKKGRGYDEHDPQHPKWHKVWDIDVLSSKLQSSPRFQAFWNKLQDYAQSEPSNALAQGVGLKKFNM